jgi:hypothetical protein
MAIPIPNRPVVDGEQLAVHRFGKGAAALVAAADIHGVAFESCARGRFWRKLTGWFRGEQSPAAPVTEAVVPPGTYLILKSIPGALRQQYGLEDDEGVVFALRSDPGGKIIGVLQCNNGAEIRLQDLREAQRLEVLSLALAEGTFAGCAEPQIR